MEAEKQYQISDLSAALFWDVDRSKLSWEQDASLLVERVLQFGRLQDWKILRNQLGIKKIGALAKQLRSLDPPSLSFISFVTGIPQEHFRCYIERQSNPTLWNS
jgi:hypothetical protein